MKATLTVLGLVAISSPVLGATTTSKAPAQAAYSSTAQVTVGPAPSICTSAQYYWKKDLKVNAGHIAIHVGSSGWGSAGSMWNVSTAEGAKLTDMAAVCPAGDCSHGVGPLSKRSDGSWYMKVTSSTTSNLVIQGLLSGNQQSNNHNAKTYPLHISGYPNCGKPVAQNCKNSNFKFDQTQWGAYKVNDFMSKYISSRGIKSFQELLQKAQDDFEPKSRAENTICDITSLQFNCPGPDWTMCDKRSENATAVSGVIMTKGITNFAAFVNFLYMALEPVSGSIGDWIDGAVATYWNPAKTENWSTALSLASSVFSVMSMAMAEFNIFASVSTAVAGAVSNAGNHVFFAGAILGLSSKVVDQHPADTTFKQTSGYKIGAQNYIKRLQNQFQGIYTTAAKPSDLINVLSNGAWVSDDIYKAFKTTGTAKRVSEWFEKIMVAQFVSRALIDNDFYIVFIPYGDKQRFGGTEIGFSDDDCAHHWVNNPRWHHAAACGMSFGPNGQKGVALFVRPWSEGADTKPLVKQSLNYNGHNISFVDILGSSLWGHQKYGLKYTLSEKESELISANGLAGATTSFTQTDLAFDYPGLFNVPVCVLPELSNVPGIGQIMKDMKKSQFQSEVYNPCACSFYTYQAPGSKETLRFVDVVSDKIKDSLNVNADSCKSRRIN